eukprot:scaffold53231_cov53-Phaeocystis_antarctica.AAC.2
MRSLSRFEGAILVLGVETITPVQLGQHLLRLAHRLERAARRLGVGAANLVGLDDSGGGGEVQGRAVVDLEAAEETERRAHGTAALGAGVLDRGAAEPRVARGVVGEGWVRLEHGAQEVGGGRLLGERVQHEDAGEGSKPSRRLLVTNPLLGIGGQQYSRPSEVSAGSPPTSAGSVVRPVLLRSSEVSAGSPPTSAGSVVRPVPQRLSEVSAGSPPTSAGSVVRSVPRRSSEVSAGSPPTSAGSVVRPVRPRSSEVSARSPPTSAGSVVRADSERLSEVSARSPPTSAGSVVSTSLRERSSEVSARSPPTSAGSVVRALFAERLSEVSARSPPTSAGSVVRAVSERSSEPAHLGRQRREGCLGEVERGERAQPAHHGRQRREAFAVVEVERGERAQPAHLGRQRREGCVAEVERGEREQPDHLGRQGLELLVAEEVEHANLPFLEGHAIPFVGRSVLGPQLTQHLTRTTEQRQCLHLLRRGLDVPGSKVLHLLLQLLQRLLQTAPPLLQAAHLLELGVEPPTKTPALQLLLVRVHLLR